MFNKEMGCWKIPEIFHYNNFIAEKTNSLLEEYKKEDKPFFIWASFPDPHYPQLVPAPYDKMYKAEDMEIPDFCMDEHKNNPPYFSEVFKKKPNLAEYKESGQGVHGLHRHIFNKKRQQQKLAYAYGMVTFMDKYIGMILDKVKELGLDDNIIIVFTTDHGDLFGQHGFIHKCIFHYEDLIRVPMIVKYKNHIPNGIRSDGLQSLVDIAPTLLDLCNIKVQNTMSGVSQSSVWLGAKEKERDYIICENRHEPHAMHLVSYVEKDYKLTVYENREYGELYDLKNDKGEHNNLWNSEEYKLLKTQMLYKYLLAEMEKDKTKVCDKTIDNFKININIPSKIATIYDKQGNNIWDNTDFIDIKISLLLKLISDIIGSRPMWMPRIAGA